MLLVFIIISQKHQILSFISPGIRLMLLHIVD